ncbi:MAG: hypothetical protein KGL39_52410 [Patescibacteria group bacterium]|nr:hypothetical protein [Patescibacteria group bacterium]
MATAGIVINPVETTNFTGTFSVESDGGVQGTFMDDPAVRYALAGGILASTETLPMWGGVGIAEAVPAPASAPLGSVVTRAAGYSTLTGFSVFNQAVAMVQSPQSRVPTAGSGMSVNFFRFGSGARIWVQADPTFAATLETGSILQQVSWDFTNQVLVAFATTALNCKVLKVNIGNSKVVTYSAGTGYTNWTNTGSAVLIQI